MASDRCGMTILTGDQDPACWSWPVWETDKTAHYARWGEFAAGDLMIDWHEGRCAMCGIPDDDLMRDHDHRTGWERGLLCRSCNIMEGTHPDRAGSVFSKYRERPPAVILGIRIRYLNLYGECPVNRPPPPWDVAYAAIMKLPTLDDDDDDDE